MKRLILVGGFVVLGLVGLLYAENCSYECAQITECEGMDDGCPACDEDYGDSCNAHAKWEFNDAYIEEADSALEYSNKRVVDEYDALCFRMSACVDGNTQYPAGCINGQAGCGYGLEYFLSYCKQCASPSTWVITRREDDERCTSCDEES